MEKNTITAVIISKNEESRIRACIESVKWVDEIIVVDSGSTDATITLASKMGAKVLRVKEVNFSKLRDIGATNAHCDWLLYLDADEQITSALHSEIEKVITSFDSASPKGYYIKRDNYYMGEKWPIQDKMHRLIYRTALLGWVGEIHETARINGTVSTLSNPLTHYTHRGLDEMVTKTNQWSEVEARLRLDARHPSVVWWRLIRVWLTGFFRSFLIESGWKAGTIGWIESMYQGFSMVITYSKLWELQQGSALKK